MKKRRKGKEYIVEFDPYRDQDLETLLIAMRDSLRHVLNACNRILIERNEARTVKALWKKK